MIVLSQRFLAAVIIFVSFPLASQKAYAWCVLNDSVLPLTVLGEPNSQSTRGQIENLKAEIKCLEQKENETMQDDFYRYNFYGLDND
jgi:hypothetical protein